MYELCMTDMSFKFSLNSFYSLIYGFIQVSGLYHKYLSFLYADIVFSVHNINILDKVVKGVFSNE